MKKNETTYTCSDDALRQALKSAEDLTLSRLQDLSPTILDSEVTSIETI